MIGKYRVVGRFPRSGQSQVFRVVHPELSRELILKLGNEPMVRNGQDGVLVDGQRLAELNHPNIVRIHDLDFHEGRPYLIMEYIRGRTLAQWASDDEVSPARAAAIVAEVAGAVAFAHRRGIVHQDIKPANILIDESGRPRLIDFGLASRQDAWFGPAEASDGGTLAFMAPEQARADHERVRPLSDVFSLGAVLYFLLTGKGPFEASSRRDSWDRTRRCDFDRSPLQKAGVPRSLASICLKAMSLEPRSRYPSADAMGYSLRRHLLMRRAAPGLWIASVALALVVSLWVFRRAAPQSSSNSPGGAHAVEAARRTHSGPKPDNYVDLRVTFLEIRHYGALTEDRYDPKRSGILGTHTFTAQLGDDVTVRASLSEPAYCYLIAFRPDGTDQVCDPDDEDTPPPCKQHPMYPAPDRSNEKYRLSEGAGSYAFVLVGSHKPLPSYRVWKKRLDGPLAWPAAAPYQPGIVWRDVGRGPQLLLADDPDGTRGKGAKTRDSGEPIAKLAGDAGPWAILSARYQARSTRVKLDVSNDGDQVVVVLNGKRLETPLPNVAAVPVVLE
jgi:hypothetical protein